MSALLLLATSSSPASAQTASSAPLSSPPTAAAFQNPPIRHCRRLHQHHARLGTGRRCQGVRRLFRPGGTPTFQCRVTNPKFILETLSVGKTYHWHADACHRKREGTKAGDAMTFTTTAKADARRHVRLVDPASPIPSRSANYPDPARLGELEPTPQA